MKSFRRILAVLCGTLGVAAIVTGAVYAYAARSLFNPDTFAQRVADGLAQPDLARIVAGHVADGIIDERRDLTPYRPLLVGSVEQVVSSAPFRALVRRAVRKAHATIVSQSGENLALTISDLGVVVRDALSMYPDLAKKLPNEAHLIVAIDDWAPAKHLATLLRMERRLRTRATIGLAFGALMCVLGAALARRKDRYLIRLGIGIAMGAFVLAAVARFGGVGTPFFVHTDGAVALVRGLWTAFIEPLTIRMLILSGIGIVLVAGVTSILEKVDVPDLVGSVARVAAARPRHSWLAFARAISVSVAGAFVAFNPRMSAEVIAVAVGAVLFFLGVQELFVLIVRALPRIEASASERGALWPRVAVVGALVFAVVGSGAWWLSHYTAKAVVAAPTDACNGHPELCGRRLNEVAFAATHNSMGSADIADWMFPNQERGIRRQLDDGIRGFLIDVHYGVPMGKRVKTLLEDEKADMEKYEETLGKDGVDAAMRIRDRMVGEETGERNVYLAHGFCELGCTRLVSALQDMNEFLVSHPGEVVMIIVQDEGVTPSDVAQCFEESGLLELVYKGSIAAPWPTLGELVAMDQRVLVFAEHNAEGVEWYHQAYEVFQETPYGFKTPAEFSNKPNRGGTSGALLLMNHWIETTPTPLPRNAEVVNAYDFLYKRAHRLRRERRMIPNLVAVDFYHTGDVVRVVDVLNGIEVGPAPPP